MAELPAVALRLDLTDRWTRLFGKPPPKYTSIQFLEQALAYEQQVKKLGGHSASMRRALKAAQPGRPGGGRPTRGSLAAVPSPSALALRPGTHLVREWNGRTHQVEVLEKGYRFDAKTYRSLSAIAKRITGAHWSGPRFFGLASP